MRAYVGLGANLGQPPRTLAAAVAALAVLPGVRLRQVSPLYLTRPVGVLDQPAFHNAVVALDVPRGLEAAEGAMALLVALKRLERAFGRGQGRRWGPRELDLDLLVFGRHRIHAPRPARARSEDPARGEAQWLEVPHASLHERLFMLAPLADLAARLVPPGWSETVAAAARRQALLEGPDAVRQVGAWDASERRWRPDADDGPRGR